MRMIDIIEHKKHGKTLSKDEITYIVSGYTNGSIPDYQMSALLMAVCLNGMVSDEIKQLTLSMTASGEQIDLSSIKGIKVDKHSTGGVGDKTSLITAPIVAACGVPVVKMSGRGLGHTGGTIDKLESIPGYQTEISVDDFIRQTNTIGISIVGQSGNLAPADKKIYALRDVTATVDSLPLIASSIMSKKLAAGADAILLDVKTGKGALMKTLDESIALAKCMIEIGIGAGRETRALITNMDVPLGNAIGNALEIKECLAVLQGKGPTDLVEVSLALASQMLEMAGKGTPDQCTSLANNALQSGKAFDKLLELVEMQGGDTSYLEHPEKFPQAEVILPYQSEEDGYLNAIDALACGNAACILGAGRLAKDDTIDYSSGIVLEKKAGDAIRKGDILAYLHTSHQALAREAHVALNQAFCIDNQRPKQDKLIFAYADKNNVILC